MGRANGSPCLLYEWLSEPLVCMASWSSWAWCLIPIAVSFFLLLLYFCLCIIAFLLVFVFAVAFGSRGRLMFLIYFWATLWLRF
jgi:hypothetical protein